MYGNYYNYLPQYQQTYPQYQQPQYQQTQSGIQWVHGESDARSFVVPSGGSVLLMDADELVFYIKSVDASGMPQPLRKFRYSEIKSTTNGTDTKNTQPLPSPEYVTRQELEERLKQLTGGKNDESIVSGTE